MLVTLSLWAFRSPTDIFLHHPRLFIINGGFLFANLICKLMLAHLTDAHYKTFRLVLIPNALAVLNTFLPVLVPGMKSPVSEEIALYVNAALSFFFWTHFEYNIIAELTSLLKIKCFTIVPSKVTPAPDTKKAA
jgi:hypothetical protein